MRKFLTADKYLPAALALSALGIALLGTPAFAQTRDRQPSQQYNNQQVPHYSDSDCTAACGGAQW
jgi:hypothetical protein